jgi:hypothetical protein
LCSHVCEYRGSPSLAERRVLIVIEIPIVRRAEGNTNKRIHRFCCSLLQRWNPTATDGMESFDVQLSGLVFVSIS